MEPRTLRIAVFSDSALPILNGVSVSIASLIAELRRLGHSVDIYTASYFRYQDPDPNTYRFPALQTPWTRGYPLAVPPFYPMLRHFRRHPYDVVHSHTPFTLGLVGLRWAQSHGIPIVSTYHTLYDKYSHYVPFFPKRYVRYKIAKHTNFYYNSVDHVITPSEAARRWLVRHSVRKPITVVPTGTPAGRMIDRAEARASLQADPEHRILLYAGRIAREKNMGTLIEGASEVLRQDRTAHLWLVGDGPYRRDCMEMVRRLGIGDRVRFVGFVPRDEVDRYYCAADLFLFASVTETQGLVVSEAMTYGLPAVVVQGGGAGASVVDGENGFLVRNDAGQLAQRALQLLSDESLYARMSDAARRSVRSYTIADMVERVLDVYGCVLGLDRKGEARFTLA